MTQAQADLLQGTLDLLILRTLAAEPAHGWAIAQRIHDLSREVLRVQQGSLYPALHRLERQGAIRSRWGASESNRRAKYYELTTAGKRRLDQETSQWKLFAAAVGRVLVEA